MSTNEAIYEFEKALEVADCNDTKYIDLLHTAIKALKHVDAIRQIVVYDNLNEVNKGNVAPVPRYGDWINPNFEGVSYSNKTESIPAPITGEWYDCGSLSCRCNRCGCKNDRESLYCPNCGSKNG